MRRKAIPFRDGDDLITAGRSTRPVVCKTPRDFTLFERDFRIEFTDSWQGAKLRRSRSSSAGMGDETHRVGNWGRQALSALWLYKRATSHYLVARITAFQDRR